MSKTLYLSPPSFDGFDGGAGARYQARREVTSYWYPTWLAQPAALTPNSRLLDCPPHNIGMPETLRIAKDFDHVIINTSTPSLKTTARWPRPSRRRNRHQNWFHRRAYDGVADGNAEGVARH